MLNKLNQLYEKLLEELEVFQYLNTIEIIAIYSIILSFELFLFLIILVYI